MITGQIKRGGSLTGSVRQSGSLAPEIFWVTYGTTTAEEIVQAIAEQKVCVMSRDNSFYYLIRYTATEYFFASFDTTSEKIKYYRFYNNSWYYNTVTYQEALTFDTTPKQFSNNPVRSYGIWNAIQAAKTTVDATLSATSENPVQNRSVYEALATKADLSSVEPFVQDAVDEWMETYAPTIGTLSNAAKRALLNCFAHVAWIDNQGQTYYNALESELFPDATLESITAVFTQGSAAIYDTYTLDALKQYLVVTANYSDSATATVTDYTLSGDLEAGTSVITASYGGKTTTFNVTVTSRIPSAYRQVEYLQSDLTQALQTNIAARNTRTLCTFQYVAMRTDRGNSFVTGGFNTDNQRYLPIQVVYDQVFEFIDRNGTSQWKDSTTNPTVDVLAKHTIDFNNVNHQAIIDGNVKATAATFACTAGDWVIAIFCRGRDNTSTFLTNTSASRVFSLLYENNDTGLAVGEFIPCYRKSDNVGGLYDLVSQQFYTDVLNGNPFVWGAEHWESGT